MNTALPVVARDPIVVKRREIMHTQSGLCPKKEWCSVHRSLPAVRTIQALDMDVTESCNLACFYCYKKDKTNAHIDEATAKNALDWLLAASGDGRDLMVNFMGGEPLLAFDVIKKMVPYGKCRAAQMGKSMRFGVTTNMTRLTDEILEFLRRFKFNFLCSVDGIPEIQNENRPLRGGGPSSPAVEKNAPKILAYQPTALARATLTPRSAPVLVECAKYFVRLGFRATIFCPAVNCEWKPEDLEAVRSQYEQMGEFYIEKLLSKEPIRIRELEQGIQSIHAKTESSNSCGAGKGLVHVDINGNFWPCHQYAPRMCSGEFLMGKLGGPFNDRLRDAFLKIDPCHDYKAGCGECRAQLTCGGAWCNAECVSLSCNFYKPPEAFCQLRRILHDQVLHTHSYLKAHHPQILESVLTPTQQCIT